MESEFHSVLRALLYALPEGSHGAPGASRSLRGTCHSEWLCEVMHMAVLSTGTGSSS